MNQLKNKILVMLFALTVAAGSLTGCSGEEKKEEAVAEESVEETESGNEEAVVMPLYPLESAQDALADGGYSVYFTAENLISEGEGYALDVEVFEYDRYEKEAIEGLKAGSQIQICQETVTVETVEFDEESAYVYINGTIEENGYELCEEDGLYRTNSMVGYPMYYSVGRITIPVSLEATFEDQSKVDYGEEGVVYTYDEMFDAIRNDTGVFGANSTVITVRGGEIVQIIRYWVP